MSVARITQAVIAARLPPPQLGAGAAAAITTPVAMAEQRRRKCGKPRAWPVSTSTSTLMPARSGGRFLSLVSTRTRIGTRCTTLTQLPLVFCAGSKREFLRRRRADALDRAVPFDVGIGVDRDRDRLAGPHIGQLGLLRSGVDPDMIGVDEKECRRRGREIFARRDATARR